MKPLLTILTILVTIVIKAQYDTTFYEDIVADLTEYAKDFPVTDEMPFGGQLKTASGTLKVLVVFVRFSGDERVTESWPDYRFLPDWAYNFIDRDIPLDNQYYQLNLSDFFNRSSGGDNSTTLGTFRVIGDVYYITTDEPRSSYDNDYEVTIHVLSKLDAQGVNFKNYDNWEFVQNGTLYQHEYKPGNGDGKVDQIFFIWRDASLDIGAGGYMPLWSPYISAWHSDDDVDVISSSGTMTFNALNGSLPKSVFNPAHEYIHYLFSGDNCTGHFDGYSRSPYCFPNEKNRGLVNSFALMCAVNAGGLGGYERYRLGWLQPEIIDYSTNLNLNDTHVKNEAIIIPLQYDEQTGWLKEFYFIENYHSVAAYPTANPFIVWERFYPEHILYHGLLVFHVEDQNFQFPCATRINIECADGKWNFKLLQGEETPSDRSDDLFYKDWAVRFGGFNERSDIAITVGGIPYNDYVCLKHSDFPNISGANYNSNDQLGDYDDFFRLNYNQVFNRFSNPAAYYYNSSTPTEVGFQILGYNSTTKEYNLDIRAGHNAVVAMYPSKPQNLRVGPDTWVNHPLLQWQQNIEEDLSFYIVEKYVTTEYGWQFLSTSTTNSYLDMFETYGGIHHHNVRYRVKAVDAQNLISGPSDSVIETVSGASPEKIGNSPEDKPDDYLLYDNYPNPFNPVTIIKYQLKENGLVKIKIFDVLGNELFLLENDYKEAGNYKVEFNGDNLSSGIYFYSMQVNDFLQFKKMNLIK